MQCISEGLTSYCTRGNTEIREHCYTVAATRAASEGTMMTGAIINM